MTRDGRMSQVARAALIGCAWLWMGGAAAGAAIHFVDQDASGPNHDGTTWCSAFLSLSQALETAQAGDTIRVADGAYSPDGSQLADPRAATFLLKSGVVIEGGYAGCGDDDPDARDVALRETILTGDLAADNDLVPEPPTSTCCVEHASAGCDDASCAAAVCAQFSTCCDDNWQQICAIVAAFVCCDLCRDVNNCDNAYHVVTSTDAETGTVLDGVTVTAGFANVFGDGDDDSGGGLLNPGGSPTLRNCTFRGNRSKTSGFSGGGGAVYSPSGNPTFIDCAFVDNVTDEDGGAALGWGTFERCLFAGNRALFGGAVYGGTRMVGCRFIGNSAVIGGALNSDGIVPTVVNCLFSGNTSDITGGAVSTTLGSPHYINCTFHGNTSQLGGALYSDESKERLSNCVLWGNTDLTGSGETAQFFRGFNSTPTFENNCVQGWSGAMGGVGNIGADPRFVDPDGSDGIPGTLDDDLRLRDGSPCVDAGNSDLVPPEITLDLAAEPRIAGSRVDMGAFEFQPVIPTVSHWGLAVMTLLLLSAGSVVLRGKQPRASCSYGALGGDRSV